MIPEIELRPTYCAICNTPDNARELYPQRLSPEAFRSTTFSARRLPDRLHYRMVRCHRCGLVRSDPVARDGLLASLYEHSTFDYEEQVPSLRRTYRRYLDKLNRYDARKGSLLEIGCGNGFFLEDALDAGYASVHGVEPSAAAVARADPHVRPNIVRDVMRPGLFGAGDFDVVCMFQVLDHVPDPAALLQECSRVLKRGGLILCLNHDVEAVSARILGSRSPIVDVEHTYLYSRRTIARLFSTHGFRVRATGTVLDGHTVAYLTRLLPLPAAIKGRMMTWTRRSPLGGLRVIAPLGNLYLVAQKR